MRSSVRTAWRAAAVAAAGGAVTLATIPAAASTAPAALATRSCATSALKVSVGGGSETAGHAHYPLEFRNVSGTRCTLFGYPGVSAIGSTGAQLGSAAGRDAAVPKRTVTLAPGATAHSWLQITDAGLYPPSTCRPVTATGLLVYPPNRTVAAHVPFSFPACSAKGPIYLDVEAVQPGAGIVGQP